MNKQKQGKPVLEVVNGQINRAWDAIPDGFTGLLYITPQQRTTEPEQQWVGLTDEERHQVMQDRTWMHTEGLCQAIEAKLKEKNT